MEYDELVHYGVKGMKWGIRRNKKRSNSSAKQKTKSDKNSVLEKTGSAMKKAASFVNRNKKTLAIVGTSAALTAVGLNWLGSSALMAYNIASRNLHNYEMRTGPWHGYDARTDNFDEGAKKAEEWYERGAQSYRFMN